MLMKDKITLDGVRRTSDGYLVADAKVARTGIQEYQGWEVGKPDMATVRVYRPEEEVFSKDALHSYAYRPVTLNHPDEAVTADNWREHAIGQTGGEVARDGEFVRVPLVLMDARAIDAVERGKRELSMGYSAELVFDSGTTPDGQEYDAIQKNLRMNHLAVVGKARGGPSLRIGDAMNDVNTAGVTYANSLVRAGKVNREDPWSFSAEDGNELLGSNDDDWANYGRHHLGFDPEADEDTKARFKYPFAKGGTLYRSAIVAIRQRASQQGDDAIFEAAGRILQSIDKRKDAMNTVNVTVDGITIETTDQGKQVIEKLQKQLSDAQAKITAHESQLAAKDAEIDSLKGKVLDEATLDAKVAARAALISKATAIAPGIHTDGKSDEDLRKAAVVAKLGDAAIAGKSQAYIDARFDILAEETSKTSDQLRDTLTHLPRNHTNDAAQSERDAHQRYLDRLTRKKTA